MTQLDSQIENRLLCFSVFFKILGVLFSNYRPSLIFATLSYV